MPKPTPAAAVLVRMRGCGRSVADRFLAKLTEPETKKIADCKTGDELNAVLVPISNRLNEPKPKHKPKPPKD